MRRKTCLALLIGFIGAVGVVEANAEDRFFQINVKEISGHSQPDFTPPAQNCYSFFDGGGWIDPLFLNPNGNWVANSAGPVTRYTATASFFGVIVLEQTGQITSNAGRGQVRLQAFSTVYFFGEPIAQFVSTGHEVDGC